ncbi:MAG: anti-sigma factor family protein [Longimicrobiales bacterium]
MSHFTEGALQAYLDHEVVAGAHAQVAAHVSECADCAARLQSLHEQNSAFTQAMAALDVSPLPQAALAELRVRAEQQVWRERLRGAGRNWTRAAILVVGVTALAVATVPGSPVRAWLISAWRSVASEPEVTTPVPAPTPTPADRVTETPTPVQVIPVAGRVRIVLQSPAAGTRVHVQLVEGEKALVEIAAKLRSGDGRLVAIGASGDVRIALPRRLTSASVEVDGRVYVLKEGDDLRYLGPTPADQKDSGILTFKPAR